MELAAQRDEQIAARARRRGAAHPTVMLRSLVPGEEAALLEVFSGLGPRSRFLRFLTAKPRLTAGDLRHLTAVDEHDHVAILAVSVDDGRAVGVARFVRPPDDPGSDDVAIAVVDRWQGRGIGTLLATALAGRAAELGVERLTLSMARDNHAVKGLLRRAGVSVEVHEQDRETTELTVHLELPLTVAADR
jgi:ribosomal protein S18 acetylase RimI-like enzyme